VQSAQNSLSVVYVGLCWPANCY